MGAETQGVDLTAYLAEKMGGEDLTILNMSRVEQGMSADTFFLDLAYTKDNDKITEAIVIRREPSGGILETYDLSKEFNLLNALKSADIAVPRVLWYEPSTEVFERPFYAMEKVEGEVGNVDPRRPSKLMFSEEERPTLARDFVSNIVKTHSFDWRNSPLVLPDSAGDESEALIRQIQRHEEVIARAGYRSHPIIALGINWLKQNAPKVDELCILHGDYRVGNFISKDGRIRAVIDWELAHLGDPHEDLAFILSPAWRSADEGLVSHVMTEAEFLQQYQDLSGRTVDPYKLMYFGAIIVLRGLDIMCSCAKNFTEGQSTDLRDGIHAMAVESLLEVLLLVLSMLTMSQDGGAV